MRKITIIGNLGKDAILQKNDNSSCLKFSVATKERHKDSTGVWGDVTCWHNVTYWGNLNYLNSILESLKKGVKVYTEGSLFVTIYNEKPSFEINSNTLVICTSNSQK